MRTFRTLGLAVGAFALAATLAPTAHAASGPGPLCKLYWERQPSIHDNGDGTYTVDPGRAYWVC
jgi:hypothetical protein